MKDSWQTAFGNIFVSKGSKFEWNFKITRKVKMEEMFKGGSAAIFIGICPWPIHPQLLNNVHSQFFSKDKKYGSYSLYTLDGSLRGPDIQGFSNCYCEDGDKLTMILDLTCQKGKLSFMKNESNDSLFVAFDKIDVDKDYTLAISFYDDYASIQMYVMN